MRTRLDVRRLYFLDWLRIAAFGLLVLYHVGMAYASWGWHVKSAHAGPAIEPLMLLSSPWRLSLLFLLSGAATSLMLARSGASGALLGARVRRLALPLVAGMALVVPPQAYLEVVHKYGYSGSFVDFLRLYFSGYGGFCAERCLILPTWNHLWFVAYLLVYSIVLWIAVRAWPRVLERLAVPLASGLRHRLLWLAPALALALLRVALIDRFPPTMALVDDWYQHASYFGLFVAGAALARQPAAWDRLAQLRWPALAFALASWLALLAARDAGAAADWPARSAFAAMQWTGVVAALGFARRWLDRDGAARRYLSDAVFPVYILHQTLVVVLVVALAPLHLGAAAEATTIAGLTVAGSLLGYEIVRRSAWLRPWFGLRTLAADGAHGRRLGA